jgi:hypothetical protein
MKAQSPRRAVMAGLAAAPVAGLPAIAGAVVGADPIFAAIERHKAAWRVFEDCCVLTDEVGAELEVTKGRISQYLREGMPALGDGRLDRDQCLNWLAKNNLVARFNDFE